ncbi:MAG: hypothetical protein COB15_16935 [Flavobacteriales bacterium]|nr:MAG: hypothetical protein COB15_16935 [Flavobacteriales bacterium]
MNKILIFLVISVLLGCGNDLGINNPEKRNESWCWFVDEKTGTGEWVPIGEGDDNLIGEYNLFFFNGSRRERGSVKNSVIIDTVFIFDLNDKLIKYEIRLKDTIEHYYIHDGSYKSYFEDGSIYEEGIVVGHKSKQNRWIIYFKSGNIDNETHFVGDTAFHRYYFESGQIKHANSFVDGKKNGMVKHWIENGQLVENGKFVNDQRDGTLTMYFDNGLLGQETIYQNGKRISNKNYRYHANGQLQIVEIYNYQLSIGHVKHWFDNGKLKYDGKMKNDLKEGKWLMYYSNGNIKFDGFFKASKKHGECKNYSENGKLKQIAIFDNGELIEIK